MVKTQELELMTPIPRAYYLSGARRERFLLVRNSQSPDKMNNEFQQRNKFADIMCLRYYGECVFPRQSHCTPSGVPVKLESMEMEL